MESILGVLQVLIAISMIAIILVQRGAGAAAGSGFGAGASATVFGSRGSGSFLTRTTGFLAVGFFAVSLFMAVLAGRSAAPTADDLGVMAGTPVPEEAGDVPAAPAMESASASDDSADVPTLEVPQPVEGDEDNADDTEGGGN